MVRVTNLDESLDFYCNKLGLVEVARRDDEKGKYTNIFLKAPGDTVNMDTHRAPLLELTYNWDTENYTGGRNFGHLAYSVPNIHEYCAHLETLGITILRPPREGKMAFIKSPDGISIELLQDGPPLTPAEPWISMPNTGSW